MSAINHPPICLRMPNRLTKCPAHASFSGDDIGVWWFGTDKRKPGVVKVQSLLTGEVQQELSGVSMAQAIACIRDCTWHDLSTWLGHVGIPDTLAVILPVRPEQTAVAAE